MKEKLIKVKDNTTNKEDIDKMMYNIKIFFVNQDEYQINKIYIGFKYLFYSYVVKVWKGINLSEQKYNRYNKILVKEYAAYHVKC